MADDPREFDRHAVAVRARLRSSGLCRSGRDSVSWQINREVIVVAGWGRAILMQIAHPLVAAGVQDHSGFRASLRARVIRLTATVGAMRAMTFGDDAEAIAVAARINQVHDRVFGRLAAGAGPFPAGTPYSAHAAHLLQWVHATLVDTMPRVSELLVGPLTLRERDGYCVEAAVMEPLLDIPAGTLPRRAADLHDYVSQTLHEGTLVVTETSRALARAVLFPPGWRLLWPLFRPVQLITLGLLPPVLREAYGFNWTPQDDRALTRWVRALRSCLRLTPGRLRHWPAARRAVESRRLAGASTREPGRVPRDRRKDWSADL